ncbi:hypothetical protein PS3A_58220 [Pseudomonas sp. 3A(2025)]
MKKTTAFAGLIFSVLASSAFALPATDATQQAISADYIAADGSDNVGPNRQPVIDTHRDDQGLAADGADRVGANRLTSDGADHVGANRLAADGADRVGANRLTSDGADHVGANRLAADGADRVGANRLI